MRSRDASKALRDLRSEKPKKYGFLRGHWKETKGALDDTDRNFARAEHVHANLGNTDIDIRTLGQTLQALVDLDLLRIEKAGSNSILYDLRGYDPELIADIGEKIDGNDHNKLAR